LKRLGAILLIGCFLGIGSGVLEYVHDLVHDMEDAQQDAICVRLGIPVQPHHHDESNCEVHAQLHMPLLMAGWTPLLICLGLFVAFLTLLDTPLIPRLVPARIDCRGPPRFCWF
jgi:hypothetical protein